MNTPFPVAIGCDEAGYELKELLKRHIEALGYPVTDFGTHSTAPVLYPDIALAVATAINAGEQRLGVLVCGTGIGMAISANKVLGIRAAQAHDTYSAERARKSNDAAWRSPCGSTTGIKTFTTRWRRRTPPPSGS